MDKTAAEQWDEEVTAAKRAIAYSTTDSCMRRALEHIVAANRISFKEAGNGSNPDRAHDSDVECSGRDGQL